MTRRDIEQQWACVSQDFDEDRHIIIQPFGTVCTHEYALLLDEWERKLGPRTVDHY